MTTLGGRTRFLHLLLRLDLQGHVKVCSQFFYHNNWNMLSTGCKKGRMAFRPVGPNHLSKSHVSLVVFQKSPAVTFAARTAPIFAQLGTWASRQKHSAMGTMMFCASAGEKRRTSLRTSMEVEEGNTGLSTLPYSLQHWSSLLL